MKLNNIKPIPFLSKSDVNRFNLHIAKSGECWNWVGKFIHAGSGGPAVINRAFFTAAALLLIGIFIGLALVAPLFAH